jgi:hypothetical protein
VDAAVRGSAAAQCGKAAPFRAGSLVTIFILMRLSLIRMKKKRKRSQTGSTYFQFAYCTFGYADPARRLADCR